MEKDVLTRRITSTSDDDSGDGTSPSLSYRLKLTSPHKSKISLETNKFEFIDIDDKDGTRRAKSHAVKEFKRRKKAEGARFQKRKESSSRQLIAAAPPPPAITILDIGRVVDPFNQFPAKLDSEKDLGLVHHYHSMFRPKVFEVANGDYLAFRELTLSVVMQDPAAFLLLVAGAAEDIALRRKKAESKQAIVYNEKALSLINNRMQVPEMSISDGAIAACTIMAGYQLLFGTPQAFNIHSEGLLQMLKLRGGYHEVQKGNPQLASLIAWHDYAGVAALVGRRRFESTSCNPTTVSQSTRPLRYTPPLNVPYKNLPKNYTLYEDLMIILEELRNATALIVDPLNKERHQQHFGFVQKINDDLIQMLSPPPKCTTPFRRFLIEDSFRLCALIYLSIAPKVVIGIQIDSEALLDHIRLKLIDPSTDWGGTIEMILKLLVAGGKVHSQQNVYYVTQLMDLLLPLDWSAWKFVRDTLLDFLLHAEVCSGIHQDLWLCRMDI